MDTLNLTAEERVNLADLSFALGDSLTGQISELTQGVLVAPGAASIVAGFVPAAAQSGGPVTIGKAGVTNSAILSRSVDGQVGPGQLIVGGNASISIDISTFPTGTYGVYVRFNRVAAQMQNRAFWSGADAAEYAKLTATRLTATWEARIETAQPAPEWTLIGQATVTAASSGGQGASVVVTDMRPLLFEGLAANGYAPGWGSAADRGGRQSATITNLAQMVDALKQCIVDIKGRGLATWSQPNISGMQVGTAFTLASKPTANQLAVGDGGLYLSLAAGVPAIAFDGTNDFLQLNRTSGVLSRWRGGQPSFSLYADGTAVFGPGVPYGYVTAIQPAIASTYTLCAHTGIPNQPASLGITSANTQSAFLEMGAAYGQSTLLIKALWNGNPTVAMAVGGLAFLTAANQGNNNVGVSIGGSTTLSSVSIPGTLYNAGRQVLSNMLPVCGGVVGVYNVTVNGDGTATGGSYNVVQFSGPNGSSVSPSLDRTGNGNNTSYGPLLVLTFNNMTVPNNAVVQITAASNTVSGGRCLSPSYFLNGNVLSVQMRNDNNEVMLQGFSFAIFFNS